MKNRYGDEYSFVKESENTYTIAGNLKYWRFGGQEGQEDVDYDNLGFVDPSGGPFISTGFIINGRPVKKISVRGELDGNHSIVLEVE